MASGMAEGKRSGAPCFGSWQPWQDVLSPGTKAVADRIDWMAQPLASNA